MTTGSGRRLRDGPIVNRWALLAVPPIAFLVAFFLVPLVVISLRSVTDFPKPTGDAFANYGRFFASAANLRVLSNTFWVAGLSTLVCLALGYPYAYLMNIVRPRVAGLLLIAVLLPFWSSLLVRTYAWQVILRDTGIINTFLLHFGFITLPLSLPGALAGSLLVFVLALGFYITPALLGSPKDTMISQFIANAVQQRLDWGIGATIAVILMGLTFVVLFVASRFIRLRDAFGSLEEG